MAVSGYSQHEYRLRTAQSGFDLHLVKPVDPRDLIELPVLPDNARAVAHLARVRSETAMRASHLFLQQLLMADTYLDLAVTTERPETRERLLERAKGICERIADKVQHLAADRAVLIAHIAHLRERMEGIER